MYAGGARTSAAKGAPRSCASKGTGAMVAPRHPSAFVRKMRLVPGGIARNGPEDAVPMALVETERLEADRVGATVRPRARTTIARSAMEPPELTASAEIATPTGLVRLEGAE
jgi:hypothetical protein